jgi:hypothetical protein
MDFLLILVAVGGFVTAVVMLVLASRAYRLQKESDARVDTLEAMATGSVLFASSEPSIQSPHADDHDLDLPMNAFADEFADEDEAADEPDDPIVIEPRPAPSLATFPATVSAYPFVMTIPAAAGAGRVQVSFDRARNRSRP